MKINLVNKQDLRASTLRQFIYSVHAINQLKEKCREYNIPMCAASVDYEKAFDSVQTQALLTSLQEQGIEDVYIEIMKVIYGQLSDSASAQREWENK